MKFFYRSLGQEKPKKKVPLIETFSKNIEDLELQSQNLNTSLEAIRTEMHTSLDVILTKTINTLRTSLVEYARTLEAILIDREIIAPISNKKRTIKDLVPIAQKNLKFMGGDKALLAVNFLAKIQNNYLSNIEDREFKAHIDAVVKEIAFLQLYIRKN